MLSILVSSWKANAIVKGLSRKQKILFELSLIWDEL